MDEIIISKNSDGSSFIDFDKMREQRIIELREEWRMRHQLKQDTAIDDYASRNCTAFSLRY
jgi:hypothetical protein